MKKTIKAFAVILLAALLIACSPTASINGNSNETKKPVIGVIQLMEHTSLNQIYDSFLAQLEALGYQDGVNCILDYKNAQGERANITSIVQTFQGSNPDVVVAIATPTAQTAMALTEKIPVIFSAVTDPIDAGVTSSLEKPDKNMTGTSDAVQVDQIIELALQIQPEAKTVGYIYNPGEANSVSNLELLKEVALEKALIIEEVSISSSADLSTAASVLAPKVDFIFVANDNTVAGAMAALAQEAIKAQTPVYTGADSMVIDGGFATVGINYTDLGKETANMVDQVLNGIDIASIPVKVFKDDLFIYVNTKVMEQLNITLPETITSSQRYIEIKQ